MIFKGASFKWMPTVKVEFWIWGKLMQREDRCQIDLGTMSQGEILTVLGGVLTHPEYESNEYTLMMKNLVKKQNTSLSIHQRRAIETHLTINKKIWF